MSEFETLSEFQQDNKGAFGFQVRTSAEGLNTGFKSESECRFPHLKISTESQLKGEQNKSTEGVNKQRKPLAACFPLDLFTSPKPRLSFVTSMDFHPHAPVFKIVNKDLRHFRFHGSAVHPAESVGL